MEASILSTKALKAFNLIEPDLQEKVVKTLYPGTYSFGIEKQ